jgi:phosphoribosyl 1,2-cyclic phosphodiesterase
MKVTIRGVRGSIPTTGPETAHYGGNTSCTIVQEDGWILVLDGGSGMQKFQKESLGNNKRIDVLLTHLHFDHIQGLGFFSPFFDPSLDVHIWGPSSTTHSLHSRLGRYLSPPLFPVVLRDLPCRLQLHEIENSSFEIGPFQIESRYVIHPGPTVGYRVKGRRSVFTYIPDHEPALGSKEISNNTAWISGFDLANNTDLLLHDAQYTAEEYESRIGWGHSSMEETTKFGAIANVKHLLLAHHDPGHTDEQLDKLIGELKAKTNYSYKYELAAEGMEIDMP